jgi:hypothetical protein
MSVEFNSGTLGAVKLESGAIATPFIMRPYDQELVTCQRYYQKLYMSMTNQATIASEYFASAYPFSMEMRTAPTLSQNNDGTATNCALAIWDNATAVGCRAVIQSGIAGISQILNRTGKADARL